MIAHENRILWLPGDERSWDEDGGSRSPAGVRISADNATMVAAVFACVRILSETVASLPLHVLERLSNGGKRQAKELPLYRRLHSQPNAWQTSFEWREQLVRHVALWGDSYSEIKPGASGAADQVLPLHPSRMKVETIENDRLRYSYREAKGRQTVYSQDQILHVRGPSDDGVHGESIAESCRDAIALARACEIHGARFFGGGARPGFILSTDNPLNAEARRELAEGWNRKHRGPHNAFETAVLTGGLKPYEIPYASNSDSQFLELRRYQLEEIARLFRIPMHLLQVGGGSYGSIEHAGLDFVQHTILPWLRRLESAFTRDLMPDDASRERYQISFDVRGLLRGDAASRASYYRSMWDVGVLSTNDILALEDMNPVEGGDVRHRPLNMGTLGESPTATDVLAQQMPGSGIDGQAVEGGVDATTQPAEDAAPQVAEVSLNGAQITGLIAIIQQVSTGLVTKAGASAMIAAAFPTIPQQQIDAILAGVPDTPVPAPATEPAADPAAPLARSLPESRSLTLSIDFDRTFAADPKLWGEFAEDAVEGGNTVVMISRREDTPENQQLIADTLGEWKSYFSQVLLIGGETLKDDAAKAAGLAVDVWVDDSPQTVKPPMEKKAKRSRKRTSKRAAPDTIAEGDWVTLADGRVGRVDHVMTEGVLNLGDLELPATPDDPAALVSVWEEGEFDDPVGVKVADVTPADEPADARGYKKPRRKRGS